MTEAKTKKREGKGQKIDDRRRIQESEKRGDKFLGRQKIKDGRQPTESRKDRTDKLTMDDRKQ